MERLIEITDGVALLAVETASKIAEFERKMKEIKAQEDELRARILTEMETNGIKKVESDEVTITYKDSYDKESFDTKTFKQDFPDLFDDYVKISACKPSIMIRVKAND